MKEIGLKITSLCKLHFLYWLFFISICTGAWSSVILDKKLPSKTIELLHFLLLLTATGGFYSE